MIQIFTISELLKQARNHLVQSKCSENQQEAALVTESILSDVLRVKRTYLYENSTSSIPNDKFMRFKKSLNKFISGEPLAYILGQTEFMGLQFLVNGNTLIPRSDTEFIVEKALKLMGELPNRRIVILDIGTGCGNIAIAVAKYSDNNKLCIFASDISKTALKIARENAKINNVSRKIIFCQGDLYNAFKRHNLVKKVNFILSNPPYVAKKYSSKLPYSVRKYEPKIALYAAFDGMNIQRRIIDGSMQFLKPNGFLLMEMGLNQSNRLKMAFKKASPLFCDIETTKDYAKHPRVICARYSPIAMF